jgi:hypothetical protein
VFDAITETNYRFVFTMTGGGTEFIGNLLSGGGLSKHVLSCNVPYSQRALRNYIARWHPTPSHVHSHKIDKYVSEETAITMATSSFYEGHTLTDDTEVVGLGCTSALQRRGDDREGREYKAFCALCSDELGLKTFKLELNKSNRKEHEEMNACFIQECLLRFLINDTERTLHTPQKWEGFKDFTECV